MVWVLQYIELAMNTPVNPGKTLLFLDEIQKAPEVFARLRYFLKKNLVFMLLTPVHCWIWCLLIIASPCL